MVKYGVVVPYTNIEKDLEREIKALGCEVDNFGEPYAFYGPAAIVYCPDYNSAKAAGELIVDKTGGSVTLFKVLEKLKF